MALKRRKSSKEKSTNTQVVRYVLLNLISECLNQTTEMVNLYLICPKAFIFFVMNKSLPTSLARMETSSRFKSRLISHNMNSRNNSRN